MTAGRDSLEALEQGTARQQARLARRVSMVAAAVLCPGPCIRQVPQEQWPHTPIQLMATAGVRLLRNGSAERIMREVCVCVCREGGRGGAQQVGCRCPRHGRLDVPPYQQPAPGL